MKTVKEKIEIDEALYVIKFLITYVITDKLIMMNICVRIRVIIYDQNSKVSTKVLTNMCLIFIYLCESI